MLDNLEERFTSVWARTDKLLQVLRPEAILAQPIVWRHPFIFYVGHLPAFAWNHILRGVLGWTSFNPRVDELFSRGIDPDVEDPRRCNPHPDVPEHWPELKEVVAYRDCVREAVLESFDAVPAQASRSIMARNGRVFSMVIEHELMHQETLLYMVQELSPELKVRPEGLPDYLFEKGVSPVEVEIPPGDATLGASFDSLDFGWDNEFPLQSVTVPAFTIGSTPVTNGEFLEFVENGAYEHPQLWRKEDSAWKMRVRLRHPRFWLRQGGEWYYRTVFDLMALSRVYDWPVYVSLAEARAYARWRGKRLPTEAEFHRAAYGNPKGGESPFAWSGDMLRPECGNFNFRHWSPTAVGSHPAGISTWGVYELVGNGWEWTDTAVGPLPGFQPYIQTIPRIFGGLL